MNNKNHFKQYAYTDELADKVVMKNHELQQRVIKQLANRTNVLDLGCGSGQTMEKALEEYPDIFITGIDLEVNQLNLANERLGRFSGRYRLVNQDILKARGEYDAIYSIVTLHNLIEKDQIGSHRHIYHLLTEGGLFINGDFFVIEDENEHLGAREEYENFLKENLNGSELDEWLAHARQDRPLPLVEQFQSLYSAGFRNINLIWTYGCEAIYRAQKQ
jgi:cyclopropane fatty-acyl-phospholipid synthase-like methyltransferase